MASRTGAFLHDILRIDVAAYFPACEVANKAGCALQKKGVGFLVSRDGGQSASSFSSLPPKSLLPYAEWRHLVTRHAKYCPSGIRVISRTRVDAVA
jgi:hypothetical protein